MVLIQHTAPHLQQMKKTDIHSNDDNYNVLPSTTIICGHKLQSSNCKRVYKIEITNVIRLIKYIKVGFNMFFNMIENGYVYIPQHHTTQLGIEIIPNNSTVQAEIHSVFADIEPSLHICSVVYESFVALPPVLLFPGIRMKCFF